MTSPTSVSFDVIARDRASQPLDQVGNRARRTGEDLERIGTHAQRGGAKLGGLFASLGGGLAAGAAAAGVTAAAALMTGFVNALDMERASDKLDAQLAATAEESARWGETAGRLYADAYGESFADVTTAIGAVVRNIDGMRTAGEEDLERMAQKVLNLANAFDQDLSAVTRAAGKLLKTGLVADADEAMDLIAQAFRSGIDEAGDLLDTLSEYSTQFREVGLSGPKALGMLAQALRAGARDADTAADAIKEFAIRSKDGSTTSREAFEAIELDADKMFQIFARGGPAADRAMTEVIKRLKEMEDPVEQDAAAVGLFGTKAEDLQDALYAIDPTTAVDALGKVEGAADDLGTQLRDNTATDIEAFKRKVELALAEMAESAISAFEDMSPEDRQAWTDLANDVRAVADEFAAFLASDNGQKTVRIMGELIVKLAEITIKAAEVGSALDNAMKVPIPLLRTLASVALETFSVIINGAAKTFFPFGGPMSDTLNKAADEFNKFKDRANNALWGISNRTVSVDVTLRGITNIQEQVAVRLGRRARGGPVKAGSAYIVGEEQAEVFVPDRDGQIIPSISQYQRSGGGAGGFGGAQPAHQVWQLPAAADGLERLFLSWLQRALRDNPGVVLKVAS